MKNVDKNQVLETLLQVSKIIFAALCGILGFSLTYWVLGLILEPIFKFFKTFSILDSVEV